MGITIASLIVIGLVLVVVEIIFIPGTTIVGVFGVLFVLAGIFFTYKEYGSGIGTYTLIGTSVAGGVLLVLSFRSGLWKKFSLTTSIEGKVNEGINKDLKVGDEGTTTSSLRPMGSAEIGNRIVEVRTNGDYLASGTKVRIVRLLDNDVIVEPVT